MIKINNQKNFIAISLFDNQINNLEIKNQDSNIYKDLKLFYFPIQND